VPARSDSSDPAHPAFTAIMPPFAQRVGDARQTCVPFGALLQHFVRLPSLRDRAGTHRA
jgi:hypothetical protein